MTNSVHTYVRKRGTSLSEPVELHYSASGRALQLDLAALAAAGLPKPDLVRGRLVVQSVEQAEQAARLNLHGLFTRETPTDDPEFYAQHPALLGPPKIQLRQTRARN